jgi:putative membrane protein insertion efficiency factor
MNGRRSPAALALLGLVHLYRLLSAPWPSPCRFQPTCSTYAVEALAAHGALRGGWLTVRRIARCQPLCEGGFDPVPARIRPSSPSTA